MLIFECMFFFRSSPFWYIFDYFCLMRLNATSSSFIFFTVMTYFKIHPFFYHFNVYYQTVFRTKKKASADLLETIKKIQIIHSPEIFYVQ